jgi:hypothetical protein
MSRRMADQTQEVPRERRRGDRRAGGRRRTDGASGWRVSKAQAAVAAVGVLVLVLLVRGLTGSDDEPEGQAVGSELDTTEPAPTAALARPSAIREVYTVAEFEGLLAEGDAAVGQTIRTELYCGSISQVTVRSTQTVNPSIAQLAGTDGRVAAAECRWSRDSLSSELLLVVPPNLAEDFARAPEVEINFVTRRQVPAEIEWLGRSEELSLRNAAVLRLIII